MIDKLEILNTYENLIFYELEQNINADLTDIQNEIIDIKDSIFKLQNEKIKDEKNQKKIVEDMKKLELKMHDKICDFEIKITNHNRYVNKLSDIIKKLFEYKEKLENTKGNINLKLIQIYEEIRFLIGYAIMLNEDIFFDKETGYRELRKVTESFKKIKDKLIENKINLEE